MSKAKIVGFLRHALTFAGGYAVAQGWLEEAAVQEVVGAVITLLGVLWSWYAPEKKVVVAQGGAD